MIILVSPFPCFRLGAEAFPCLGSVFIHGAHLVPMYTSAF